MPQPLITIDRISVRQRDRWLLEGLSWQINKGEVWSVIGANGAGKTTLAKAIAGLLPVVKGKIHYHGFGDGPAHDSIAYLSSDERRNLWRRERELDHGRYFSGRFSDVTRVRNWVFPEAVSGTSEKKRSFVEIIETLNLDILLDKPVMALSTGEMSRVRLAGKLVRRPKLLILDEPFDGIDSSGREELRRILCRLPAMGTPIVLITHRQEEMLNVTTHLLTLCDGGVVDASPVSPVCFGDKKRRRESIQRMVDASWLPEPEVSADDGSSVSKAIVEMKEVTVRYGDTIVLDRINWTVREGECWSVTGPNGAGKSILLKLITGECLQVYANRIQLFGRERGADHSLWEIRQKIGVVNHDLAMGYQKKMTALEVVCSGFFDTVGLYRYCDAVQHHTAETWMERLHLSSISQTDFNHLSQGQRQMVLIARAMVKAPQLLILDEPCSGLDPDNRREVLRLVETVACNGLGGLIFVTHHKEEIPRCTTHRLVLNQGIVVLNRTDGAV